MPAKHIRSYTPASGGGGQPPEVIEAFVDNFALTFSFTDSNTAPTDDATLQLNASYAESNAGQGESVTLKLPSPPDFVDDNAAPTDGNLVTMQVWLANSAGAGVTNPANADGENDGSFANISTAALGSNTETLTSDAGSQTPSGLVLSEVIYRGWFNANTPAGTSTAEIVATSVGGLFSDIVMYSLSGLGASIDSNDGHITFDLTGAGIDTEAKLQSLQVLHRTTDLVAGVTPAVMNVDAGALEIVGAFI